LALAFGELLNRFLLLHLLAFGNANWENDSSIQRTGESPTNGVTKVRIIGIEEASGYLEVAKVEQTIQLGHAVVNVGVSEAGHRFVLLHDYEGNAALSESL
jgi:hypothetical protein